MTLTESFVGKVAGLTGYDLRACKMKFPQVPKMPKV